MQRLTVTRAAKQLGLPLEEIARLLDVWSSGDLAERSASWRDLLAALFDTASEDSA